MNTTTTGRAIRSSLRAGQNNPYLAILTTPSRRYASRHASGGGEFAGRKGRKGFTLVEVIVVLVILAILAAIAIPVLTGYIDKAREKEYIAEARNRFVAMKAICNEAYANGDLATWLGGSLDQVYNGINPDNYNGFKIFAPKTYTVEAKIDELLGNPTYPGGSDAGHWVLFPLGAKAPETTLFNADGFQYSVRLDPASVTNRRTVMITYKVDRVEDGGSEVEMNTRLNNGVYNPNAGYEVYYTDH